MTVHEISLLRAAVEASPQRLIPGAHIAERSMFNLIVGMYHHPAGCLNGSAPLNITSAARQYNASNISVTSGDRDSFSWFDDLHPSEQAERDFARALLAVLKGTSQC